MKKGIITAEIHVNDEDHIFVDGQQFVSLKRFTESKNDMIQELNSFIARCDELSRENDAYRTLLASKIKVN